MGGGKGETGGKGKGKGRMEEKPKKPTKEEKEEVMENCMCIPNLALYSGAVVVKRPETKPGKGKGKVPPTGETPMSMETTPMMPNDFDYEGDEHVGPTTRAMCNEKVKKNFKVGKNTVKCSSITLVYTDAR